jgi:predicted metal-dependent hydrolase
MALALRRSSDKLHVAAAGRRVPVVIKRNARARRIILRVDEALGMPVLTLPRRASLDDGARFIRQNVAWLEEQLRKLTPSSPFAHGATFPFRGLPCRIRSRPGRGNVALEKRAGGYLLTVPGEPEFLARRVTDFLRKEARRELTAAVERHEKAVGRKSVRIRISDPKSRWGSCSSNRVLTFSWRLILAPPRVLDYLAAHEVAHLREMNHGPKFWALVDRLDPDHRIARAWLSTAGVTLSAIGRPPV